ncbi:MAG TPA: glycoside hydrolase family 3 N-terminal domain-containing protein [Gaiellaceae bacterium]|nr:glycoside hydrolase family 3 N-terminal domain-containing protein [Gaiellaceae bacterium]
MDELAAAVLLPSFPGATPPDWIRRFLAAGGGGITLFSYNGPDFAAVNAALRAERPDLLTAIDEEGGDVTRLESDEGSSYPGNAALGAIDDVVATESVAEAIGAQLAAAGVNWNFAPVADVNVPGNPVIGVRSFGSDVALVARHTAAYVRGLQRAGVAACAKHFPGHGSTEQDSHLELPTVTGNVETGLEPFRAAVAAGTKSVMTAHIRVPAFGDLPATTNAPLLGLLRAEFDGVIVSDALEMKGLSGAVGVERAAVLALEAGCDALCVGHDLHDEAVTAIAKAISDGVARERLEEAAARVRTLAEWATLGARQVPDTCLDRDVARRAVTLVGDVRVRKGARIVELSPAANIAAGEHLHTLDGATFVREGEAVPDADVYIVRDAHRHAWMREAADRPDAVVIEVGLPEWRPCRARGYVATRGRSRVSLDAAREVLGL